MNYNVSIEMINIFHSEDIFGSLLLIAKYNRTLVFYLVYYCNMMLKNIKGIIKNSCRGVQHTSAHMHKHTHTP